MSLKEIEIFEADSRKGIIVLTAEFSSYNCTYLRQEVRSATQLDYFQEMKRWHIYLIVYCALNISLKIGRYYF